MTRIDNTLIIKVLRQLLLCLLMLSSSTLWAAPQHLIMGRSLESFPEAILTLQLKIKEAGYTVSFIQRVDIGLTASGFETDKFRVVFFAKPEQIEQLTQAYPDLAPYLPLAISIFAEKEETVMTAMSPLYLKEAYPQPELRKILLQWDEDIKMIIHQTSKEGT